MNTNTFSVNENTEAAEVEQFPPVQSDESKEFYGEIRNERLAAGISRRESPAVA